MPLEDYFYAADGSIVRALDPNWEAWVDEV